MSSVLLPGDLVWCYFPYREKPDLPGPELHVAVMAAVFGAATPGSAAGARAAQVGLAIGLYTSTQIARFGRSLPVGILKVGGERARMLGGQKPFFIDVRLRAYMPLQRAFFPDLNTPSGGRIGTLDPGLFRQVVETAQLLNNRHRELITCIGPLRPQRQRGT